MKTDSLYKIANKNNIRIDFFPLEKTKSVFIMMDDRGFIGIDNSAASRSADEKVCLAHELGHYQTGSLYNMYSPLDIREKHEKRADRWAISKLVPKNKLTAAIKGGNCDIPSLADYFGVTEDFMTKAIKYYREN